ncbi:MAG: hypothetical protein AAB434_01990, partial [Planctomycetota bacterium]
MPDSIDFARSYLTPPAFLFWRWSDGGRVVTWTDGATIAFREEVSRVILRLAPGGLPDFGAVVVLLAACREAWIGSAEGALSEVEGILERYRLFGDGFARVWIGDMRSELRRLAVVAPRLPAQPDAKAVLAEAVFEGWRDRGPREEGLAVAVAIEGAFEIDPASTATISQETFIRLLEGTRGIRSRLESLAPGAIDLRLRTGLDAVPKAAPVEPPASVGVRSLLSKLRDDRELSGLARLAQNLMAAVHVPRSLSEPEELPLGGYSDLANRGPLDRLLASELAHDDMTLAARVALNEALYLRREAPPRTLSGKRLLLLDAGIRMWGVPRVFGTAVALALAATADRRKEVEAWRAEAGRIAKADLSLREGLVAHLEALEPAPHPGAALPAFLDAVRAAGGASDAVLITHEDVLADPDFRAALSDVGDEALYVATVARGGAYRLYAVSARGRRVLSEATLSLDALFESPRREMPGAPLVAEGAGPNLPVILSVEPFPLLLPHHVDVRRSRASAKHGVVAATKDGRLMHWGRAGHGARQLTALVPHGPLHWMSIEPDGVVHVLAGARPGHRITMLAAELEGGRCSSTEMQASGYPPLGVARHLSSLFLVFKKRVDVFDLRSGEQATSIELPSSVKWQHGRYLCDGQRNWFALATDGLVARLQAISIPRNWQGQLAGRKTGPLLALFDREGHDGPWAVTLDGTVVATANDGEPHAHEALGGPVELIGASHDGHRIVLRGRSQGSIVDVLFDLAARTTRPISGDPHPWIEPDVVLLTTNSQNLRHKFSGIGVSDGGRVALLHDTGFAWVVSLDRAGDLVLAVSQAERPRKDAVVAFQPTYSPPGTRYALRMAVFRDGSRAYLDSRGM